MNEEWAKYRLLRAMDGDAAEKGRLAAAHQIASDLESRKRVEQAFGVDFCRVNYPEAYRSGFSVFLDRVREAVKW